MARSVGEVYVTVIANTALFKKQVERAASDAADGAGTTIDKKLTDAFYKAGKKWKADERTQRLAAQTGKQIAETFGLAFEDGMRDVGITTEVRSITLMPASMPRAPLGLLLVAVWCALPDEVMPAYSGSMPAALVTRAHMAVSLACSLAKSAGDRSCTSPPVDSCPVWSAFAAAWTSALSLLTMSAGVLAGRYTPAQLASK